MIDEAIMSSMHEAGSADDRGVKHEEKMKAHLLDVVDAFDRAQSFLGGHDDNVAMNGFLQYEDTAVKLQPMVLVHHMGAGTLKRGESGDSGSTAGGVRSFTLSCRA